MAIIHVRLRDGIDDDVVAWYDAQLDKSGAVREAIRAYVRLQNGEGRDAAIDDAVTEALGAELARLPEVVTQAVRDALAAYRLAPAAPEGEPGEEDPELAARLDAQLDDFFGE